jgi:hypothetical protein
MDLPRPAWCDVLNELYGLIGTPGLRAVNAAAAAEGVALSKSTVANLLEGTTNPRETSVLAFVNACLRYGRSHRSALPPAKQTTEYWLALYRRSRAAADCLVATTSASWPVPPQDAKYRFDAIGSPAPRPALGKRAPSYLLDSLYEIVPFHDRGELHVVQDWVNDPDPRTSIQLMHGEGGQGKTRLAMHIARHFAQDGWQVVQASRRAGPAPRSRRPSASGRILVIVDYAERWPVEILERMVLELSNDPNMRSLRVLLLARSDIGLWDLLTSTLDRQVDHLAIPIHLKSFTSSIPEQISAFNDAVAAFQSALELQPTELAPNRMRKDVDDSPLSLHMAALAAVLTQDHRHAAPSSADLSEFLLRHEQKYWSSSLTADLPALAASIQIERISKTVALATLLGPLATSADARLLLCAGHLASNDTEAQLLIDHHAQLYPFESTSKNPSQSVGMHLKPLSPDRFAEDFVAWCVHRPKGRAFIRDVV